MTNRLMISVAAAALIAGSGFANAQGTGGHEPSAGAATQKSATSPERGSPETTPMNRESTQPAGRASDMKGAQSDQKPPPGATKNERAEDNNTQDQKSKSMRSETNDNAKSEKDGGKDMKAEGRNDNMNKENRGDQTTGQAGGGAKLSGDQRTRISSVIRDQHVAPVTNVNFSMSVGTRVPRDVGFHPLPAEIVTIYPDWRGYEFFLVRDQVVVVDPRTLEIVAVIDA